MSIELNRQTPDRVRELDKLFRDPSGHTYEELISLLREKGITACKRTIQSDISTISASGVRFFIPEKRGGHDKVRIRYEDPSIPPVIGSFSEHERAVLDRLLVRDESPVYKLVATMLRGFSNFENIKDLKDYVDFGDVLELDGMEHFQSLLDACLDRKTISFQYSTFRGKTLNVRAYPYMLKAFNGRWFLLCRRVGRDELSVYALDRIVGNIVRRDDVTFEDCPGGRNSIYERLEEAVGMTGVLSDDRNSPRCEGIRLKVSADRYRYIETKPIHPFQEMVEEHIDDGRVVLDVPVKVINRELVTMLLSFGPDVEVVSPPELRRMIKERISQMGVMYE